MENNPLSISVGTSAGLWSSIERVRSLIEIYDIAREHGDSNKPMDILRAGVVLLHAGIEELLRDLILYDWINRDSNILNAIPLAGRNEHKKPSKFLLGDLAQHRGKTIDEVILESVKEYLSVSNFNSISEIARIMKSMDIEPKCSSKYHSTIEEIIQRRHLIVHRGDIPETRDVGPFDGRYLSISKSKLTKWVNAVEKFSTCILNEYCRINNIPTMREYFDSFKS